MTARSTQSSANKRNETWEEKEARRLCRNVYDHLAYYIQVQLPEERFTCSKLPSSRCRSGPFFKQKTEAKLLPRRKFHNVKLFKRSPKIQSGRPTRHEDIKQGDHSDSICQANGYQLPSTDEGDKISSPVKKTDEKSKTKRTSIEKSSAGYYPSNKVMKRKERVHRTTFVSSPYNSNPHAKIYGRTESVESMRRKAERVASTATELLQNISLNEVMAIQRYRSPSKYLLRCSSSLSDHPNGMLTSNHAIRYAADHDDRQSARNYARNKERKRKRTERLMREKEMQHTILQKSFREKPNNPHTPMGRDARQSSSSETEDISLCSSSLTSNSASSAANQSSHYSAYYDTQKIESTRGNQYNKRRDTKNAQREDSHSAPRNREKTNDAHKEYNCGPNPENHSICRQSKTGSTAEPPTISRDLKAEISTKSSTDSDSSNGSSGQTEFSRPQLPKITFDSRLSTEGNDNAVTVRKPVYHEEVKERSSLKPSITPIARETLVDSKKNLTTTEIPAHESALGLTNDYGYRNDKNEEAGDSQHFESDPARKHESLEVMQELTQGTPYENDGIARHRKSSQGNSESSTPEMHEDDASSTTSSLRRIIEEARISLSGLETSSPPSSSDEN